MSVDILKKNLNIAFIGSNGYVGVATTFDLTAKLLSTIEELSTNGTLVDGKSVTLHLFDKNASLGGPAWGKDVGLNSKARITEANTAIAATDLTKNKLLEGYLDAFFLGTKHELLTPERTNEFKGKFATEKEWEELKNIYIQAKENKKDFYTPRALIGEFIDILKEKAEELAEKSNDRIKLKTYHATVEELKEFKKGYSATKDQYTLNYIDHASGNDARLITVNAVADFGRRSERVLISDIKGAVINDEKVIQNPLLTAEETRIKEAVLKAKETEETFKVVIKGFGNTGMDVSRNIENISSQHNVPVEIYVATRNTEGVVVHSDEKPDAAFTDRLKEKFLKTTTAEELWTAFREELNKATYERGKLITANGTNDFDDPNGVVGQRKQHVALALRAVFNDLENTSKGGSFQKGEYEKLYNTEHEESFGLYRMHRNCAIKELGEDLKKWIGEGKLKFVVGQIKDVSVDEQNISLKISNKKDGSEVEYSPNLLVNAVTAKTTLKDKLSQSFEKAGIAIVNASLGTWETVTGTAKLILEKGRESTSFFVFHPIKAVEQNGARNLISTKEYNTDRITDLAKEHLTTKEKISFKRFDQDNPWKPSVVLTSEILAEGLNKNSGVLIS